LVSLFNGVAPKSWRQTALIEHQRPESDPDDPDVAAPGAGNPPSYAALRFADALYVEYDDVWQTRSYYDLVHDPFELHNIVDRLEPDRLDQLHQRLEANKRCRGSDDCWRAQSVRP
jgi:N-acetylglucosamine-6-sulfatase